MKTGRYLLALGVLAPTVYAFRNQLPRPIFYSTSSILNAKKNNDKVIDVDFFDPDEKPSQKNTKPSYNPNRNEDEDSSSSILGSAFIGIKKFFGQDEESLRKKEQKAELDRTLDEAFKGTGLFGTIAKGLVKSVGGMVMEGMKAQANQMQEVNQVLLESIRADSRAVKEIGFNPQLGFPMQQSSSSMNINGVQTSTLSMVLPVTAESGELWQCSIEASSGSDSGVIVKNALLQSLSSGKQILLKGSSGGSGGSFQRGQVIDV